jgi:hypothetical protein
VDTTWVDYTALEQVTYALIEHEIPWRCICVLCGQLERAEATTRRIRLKTGDMVEATLMVTI